MEGWSYKDTLQVYITPDELSLIFEERTIEAIVHDFNTEKPREKLSLSNTAPLTKLIVRKDQSEISLSNKDLESLSQKGFVDGPIEYDDLKVIEHRSYKNFKVITRR